MWETWKAFSLGMAKLTRTLVLPPGTPSDRVAVLRKGIKMMAKDPGFIRDWEKIFGQPIAPLLVDPAEGDQVKDNLTKPAPWQGFVREFVWGKS